VALNESLKKQIASFKDSCKAEREDWQKRMDDLQSEIKNPKDDGRGELILDTFKTDSLRLSELREAFAAKNRELAIVKRKIDSFPSRREVRLSTFTSPCASFLFCFLSISSFASC